jgi:signal peptidase
VTYFEPTTDGVDVEPRETVIQPRSTVNATLTLSAPPETGYYRQYLVEHRYLAVLPQTTIRALYHVHPWAPIIAIDLLLGGAFFGIAVGMVGLGRTRIRSRGRDIPLTKRIQRWLR